MSSVGFVSQHGFVVPVLTVRQKFGPKYQELLNKLTLINYQKIGPPQYAPLYEFITVGNTKCIVLPRTLIKVFLAGKILTSVEVMLPVAMPKNFNMITELYANQKLILEHLMAGVFTGARANAGTAAGILNLRAGMGKTFVAAGIISRVGLKTLYVVPKRPLATQTLKDFRGCFYPEDDAVKPNIIVGMYGKHLKKSEPALSTHDVTVIVINSALLCDQEFFSRYSFVIFDEVHMYCSKIRKAIFRKASARYMLGMSATTEDRRDGFDPIAHKELAFDGIIRAENIPGFTYEDVNFLGQVRVIYYNGPEEYTKNLRHESTGMVFTHYMHNQYINDPYRLQLAMDELIALYDWRGEGPRRHRIYVFAEEVEILIRAKLALCNLLAGRRDDIVADIGFDEAVTTELKLFTGGIKDNEIGQISKTGRVLFSTYAYGGTGISITDMTAELLLTPRRTGMKQVLARIMRRGSDLTIPRIIVDIVDNKTSLKHQVADRKNAYEFYNFTEIVVKKQYAEINLLG